MQICTHYNMILLCLCLYTSKDSLNMHNFDIYSKQ